MKTNKTYYPIVAAACLAFGALIPMSPGDENQESPAIKATPIANEDKMLKELNTELIDPLNVQATLWGSFSRRGPTHSVSYYLVENREKDTPAERSFTIMKKQTPLSKAGTEKTSEYLKLRYQAKEDQFLVKQKDSWIALADHPILKNLKNLPKTEIQAKTPLPAISS